MYRLHRTTYNTITTFIATEEFVRDITGYTFSNRHLLLVALCGDSGGANVRQRLAFLGDGLLKYVLSDAWYDTGASTGK